MIDWSSKMFGSNIFFPTDMYKMELGYETW